MKKTVKFLVVAILPMLTLILGWQLGVRFQQRQLQERLQELNFIYSGQTASGSVLANPEQEVDLGLMWGVWRLLLKHYIAPDKMQVQEMLYGAVHGLVDAIEDPYTVFMTPSENSDFRQSLNGDLQGIGAELTLRDGEVVVVAPLKGSPAALAGLQPEDIIVEVDGKSVAGESLQQTVQRIRGQQGTTVALSIRRAGESQLLHFDIKRAHINIPSIESELKETGSGTVGYVAINQFGDTTTKEMERALQSFQGKALSGIVLDVRFNGGGYLERAVDITSMFVAKGTVVTVARRSAEPDIHYVYGRPVDTLTPMVVLINEGSASASEILAGALQDLGRATIIGKKSFGKGTVQEIFDLPGGSSLRVTVARWLTPNGKDLGADGVHPDIEIERSPLDIVSDDDPQLEAALKWLLTEKDEETIEQEAASSLQ